MMHIIYFAEKSFVSYLPLLIHLQNNYYGPKPDLISLSFTCCFECVFTDCETLESNLSFLFICSSFKSVTWFLL